MKLAVMQPYLFPYIGYYQLIRASDVFVAYDDAKYIKNGFINRNRVLVNGEPGWMTVPVLGASSNVEIRDVRFSDRIAKVLRTITQNYSKAPHFRDAFAIVEKVLAHDRRDVPSVCAESLVLVMRYLGFDCEPRLSSGVAYDRDADASGKLIGMCKALDCDGYVNAIGGRELYSKEYFASHGVALSFLHTEAFEYPQRPGQPFVANLSIIDLLMWNSREQVAGYLDRYRLA